MRKQGTLPTLFDIGTDENYKSVADRTTKEKLQRLDVDGELREKILKYCRLKSGEVWVDPLVGHRVGALDAADKKITELLRDKSRISLFVNDPPYNVAVGNANTPNLFKRDIEAYLNFSSNWVDYCLQMAASNSNFYVWMGADYKDNFQPLPDFMVMMRSKESLTPKNLITMRNQRGYGTQKNWMWVRQELLHYVTGSPVFNVNACYTDIPKILRGYYKEVNGKKTENLERSKSPNIRAGNVWVDVQQVFYRMEENVPGCYAQKPMKAIERIIESSSNEGDLIADVFSHSGTTLIAGDKLNRRVFTNDIDPIFAEISIRRLERFRATGLAGWQWNNPFPEIDGDNRNRRWT